MVLIDEIIQDADPKTMVNDEIKVWCSGFRTACRKAKSAVNERKMEVLDLEGKNAMAKLWEDLDTLERHAIAEAPTLVIPNNSD